MELIINLIIILVIIFAVIKRLKKDSEKGRELEAPSPAIPQAAKEEAPGTTGVPQKKPGAREILKELFKELEEASREKPLEQMKEPETEKPPLPVELQETVIPVPVYSEDTREWIQEDLIQTAQEEPFQTLEASKPRLPDYVKKAPKKKPVPGLHLSFSGSDVVRGIVMSEILSPPISMR